MKKKKAFIGLVMVGMLVAVGGISLFLLEYFSSGAGRSNAGGDLSIDYFVSEKELDEEESDGASSQNIFQWLAEKLSSDKNKGGDEPAVDPADPSDLTQSGISQNRRDNDETDLEELLVEQAEDIIDPAAEKVMRESERKDDKQDSTVTSSQEVSAEKDDTPDTKKGDTVTMSIRCDTAVAKGMSRESKWVGIVPSNGIILPATEFEIKPGETVFSVISRASTQYKFQMEYNGTNGAEYIEGINNLYEFDGGRWSGWMYCVNGWYPNYGCGQYALKGGDVIEWNYTCDLGKDLGQTWEGEDWTETHE